MCVVKMAQDAELLYSIYESHGSILIQTPP